MQSRFFAKHADTLALVVGVILALLIIVAYGFGISDLATDLNKTLDPNSAPAPTPSYDLEAARSLNLKGLTPGR